MTLKIRIAKIEEAKKKNEEKAIVESPWVKNAKLGKLPTKVYTR